jgi:hypothetical protein
MVDGGTIIISCGCWKFVDPDKWQEVQCSVNGLLASWNTAYWLYVPCAHASGKGAERVVRYVSC